MNRRGIIIPLVTILGMIVLLYAAFTVYSESNKPATKGLGNLQYEMITLQQKGEQRLFYVDQLAKHAGCNAAKELTDRKIGGCDYWDSGDCNPQTRYKSRFKYQFGKEFEKLTSNIYFDVPKIYNFEIEAGDYITTITGKTSSNLKLEKIEKFKVFYEVNPSFKQEIKYGERDYRRFMELLGDPGFDGCLRIASDEGSLQFDPEKSVEKTCKNLISSGLRLDFDWKFKKNKGIVSFTVTSKSALECVGKVVYKFAIDLNKQPLFKTIT